MLSLEGSNFQDFDINFSILFEELLLSAAYAVHNQHLLNCYL